MLAPADSILVILPETHKRNTKVDPLPIHGFACAPAQGRDKGLTSEQTAGIAADIIQVMEDWKIPEASVAVLKDGEVV